MAKRNNGLKQKKKIQNRAETILRYLYEFIEDTKELSIDETKDSRQTATNEALTMMHVAASFAAHVIEQASLLGIDINLVYEDHLTLLDLFLAHEAKVGDGPAILEQNESSEE